MADKLKDKELERSILELNMMNNKLQEMEQQLQIIEKQIQEFQLTSIALQDLETTRLDNEVLSPIGQNIFVKSKLLDNNEVFVDIGSKIFAKKSIPEAQEIINKKFEDFVSVREKIVDQAQMLAQEMMGIQKDIQESQ